MSEITAYAGDLINTEDMTIAENLERIINAKLAIKDAITAKGGQVAEDARIDQYPAVIEALPSGGEPLNKLILTKQAGYSSGQIRINLNNISLQNPKYIKDGVEYDVFNLDEFGYTNTSAIVSLNFIDEGILSFDGFYYKQYLSSFNIEGNCVVNGYLKSPSIEDLFKNNGTTKLRCGDLDIYSQRIKKLNISYTTKYPNFIYQSKSPIYMFGLFDGYTIPEDASSIVISNVYYDEQCSIMFRGSKRIKYPPQITATNTTQKCYNSMFSQSSIVYSPDLPATSVASSAYTDFCYDCKSLMKTGKIAATGSISSNTSRMFYGCTSLKEMTWTATTPPSISSDMLTNCPSDMIIFVPNASVSKYKTASVWSSRAAYILPIMEEGSVVNIKNYDITTVESWETFKLINVMFEITSGGNVTEVSLPVSVEFDENNSGEARNIEIPFSNPLGDFTIHLTQTANDTKPELSVTTSSTYGFNLDDDGYYVNTNKSTSQYSYATVSFVPNSNSISFQVIKTGTANQGYISRINQNLQNNYNTESSTTTLYKQYLSDTKDIVVYSGLTPGNTYFFTIKYRCNSTPIGALKFKL